MKRTRARRWAAAGLASVLAGALLLAPGASAAGSSAAGGAGRPVAELKGLRGIDVGPDGELLVSKANGAYGTVGRSGEDRGTFTRLGRVPASFLAPALDANEHGDVFVLTLGGERGAEGAGILYRWTEGQGQIQLADIMRYQRRNPDPYDLEDNPKESNPYAVAALDDGSALVADAAANNVLRVFPDGSIVTVAQVKPRTVKVPKGMGEHAPPAGTRMPSEAVVTAVAVGDDGSYYVGELRGFPATPRTSQVWRLPAGTEGAVCDPEAPRQGPCKRYVADLTSVVGLETGPGGSLYALELAKRGWIKAESGDPALMVGRLVRIGHDRSLRHQLGKGRLVAPGDVAVAPNGAVFATTPIFGRGSVLRLTQ